ncbi:hypothetical protein [Deinococcus aerophilus]|uniref:Cytochrome c domain-containing protein n=1 Tax=Deinococcus aerophilus TaxID=522488 RepID=A0ABQ2GV78_9DEIO|nr:hypothetical protein [Deinococcus aerophilus]GGM13549.1 hypothetical protein GCM10010841_22690 [Deinococcus aerophilus]
MGRLNVRWMGGGLATLVLLGAPVALALPKYRLQAIPQLRYDADNPLWTLDRRVMACTYCHVHEGGGAPWNPFGEAIRAGFRADAEAGGKGKFPDVLYATLQAGQDADGDGYPDALEVFARTLPGDPASRPDQPLAEVQAAFAVAGGVEQYAPAKGTPKK